MGALEELVAIAEREPPSQSLPRLLRAAVASSDEELARWARLESMGYFNTNSALGPETLVPQYRTVPGHWRDDFDRPLVLDDPKLAFINELRLRNGAAELESMAGAARFLTMRAIDNAGLIRQHLGVEVTTFVFAAGAVAQVVANIRVELLDRLMSHRGALEAADASVVRQPPAEIVELKPSFYGLTIDLKALWRKWISK